MSPAPEIGDLREYLGQFYVVVGTMQRNRVGGAVATILTWSSACADCGDEFTLTTPVASAKFQPNRRCQRHKRPGVRVKGAR